jgi:hypothetical protein
MIRELTEMELDHVGGGRHHGDSGGTSIRQSVRFGGRENEDNNVAQVALVAGNIEDFEISIEF